MDMFLSSYDDDTPAPARGSALSASRDASKLVREKDAWRSIMDNSAYSDAQGTHRIGTYEGDSLVLTATPEPPSEVAPQAPLRSAVVLPPCDNTPCQNERGASGLCRVCHSTALANSIKRAEAPGFLLKSSGQKEMTLLELARLSPAPAQIQEAPKKRGRPPKAKPEQEEPKASVRTSDLDAAKVFMERCGHLFVRQSNKQVYFYIHQKGVWEACTSVEDAVSRCVVDVRASFATFLILPYGEVFIDYGGDTSRTRAMSKKVEVLIPQKDLDLDTAYGKLLFSNGTLDLRTGVFVRAFSPSIVFYHAIPYAYVPDADEDAIALARHVLFEAPYEHDGAEDRGVFLMQALACGLVGDYKRQKAYFLLGDTSTGKGTLTEALGQAFGKYAATWDVACLLSSTMGSTNQDKARKLFWVGGLEGTRIALSNEAPAGKVSLDGSVLKALTGGGDQITTREAYGKERSVVNRTTLFTFANDICPIAPQDAAVDKRVLYIRPTTSFMTTPTEPHHRKADPRVRDMFKMERYKVAVVHLLMQVYRALPDAVKEMDDDITVPPSVAAETKEQTETGGFLSLLEDGGFEITHDPNDYVRCAEVCDYMARHGMSKQRVGREMKKHTKVEGAKVDRTTRVYHGIRRDGNLLR